MAGYYYSDAAHGSLSHLASFCYDYLNRLNGALTQSLGAGAPANCSGPSRLWGETYVQDRYGNWTNTTVTAGSPPALNVTVNGYNQITSSGFSYDAAGNMVQDGSWNSYQYDPEGRLISATASGGGSAARTYNAVGQLVEWTVPGWDNQLIYDPLGHQVGVYEAGTGSWCTSCGFPQFVNTEVLALREDPHSLSRL